jgi:hypothetical protein
VKKERKEKEDLPEGGPLSCKSHFFVFFSKRKEPALACVFSNVKKTKTKKR